MFWQFSLKLGKTIEKSFFKVNSTVKVLIKDNFWCIELLDENVDNIYSLKVSVEEKKINTFVKLIDSTIYSESKICVKTIKQYTYTYNIL